MTEGVETIPGLAPHHAESLAAAGVETIDDLASADPDHLADETGIDRTRIAKWIERATAETVPDADATEDDAPEEEPEVPEANEAVDAFEREGVEELDRDALWDQVAGEDPSDTEDRAGSGDVDREERTVRVVDKTKYCRGCEYFSAPPEVACTHEGAEILDAPDMDHFRVVDCPIVAEDEQLENV